MPIIDPDPIPQKNIQQYAAPDSVISEFIKPPKFGALSLPFKQLHPDAKLPVRSTDHAAAYDFFSVEDYHLWEGESRVFRTGLAVAVPQGKVLLMFSRSGMGFTSDISLSNSVGVIDSDYRGEIMVKLIRPASMATIRAGADPVSGEYYVAKGDRIAQGLVIDRYDLEPHWVNELPDPQSNRTGGFGHTGA